MATVISISMIIDQSQELNEKEVKLRGADPGGKASLRINEHIRVQAQGWMML